MHFGELMKQARKRTSLSVPALANVTGIPSSTLYRIETSGRVTEAQKAVILEHLPELLKSDRCPLCLREKRMESLPISRVVLRHLHEIGMSNDQFLTKWRSRISRAIVEGRACVLRENEIRILLGILPNISLTALEKANRAGYRIIQKRTS